MQFNVVITNNYDLIQDKINICKQWVRIWEGEQYKDKIISYFTP